MITCRICKREFVRWWRGVDGKSHSGYGALRLHFDDEHQDVFDLMSAKFTAEERNKLPNEARE